MQLMRDFGVLPSAQDAFLLDLGLQTLPVRMAQHCKNAFLWTDLWCNRSTPVRL